MHLQFPLKQCWKNLKKTNGAKCFKFLADNATLEELSELKKNNTFLERVYSFAANSVKRLTSDVAERDRQILALQQEIRNLQNQPGVPLASRWSYCIFIFIADDTRVTKLMFLFEFTCWRYAYRIYDNMKTSSYSNFCIYAPPGNFKYTVIKKNDKAMLNVWRMIKAKFFRNLKKEHISFFFFFVVHWFDKDSNLTN